MRSLVGAFGSVCGLIVIGLVGRYGYKTTDVEVDAWIMAFLFGAIAAGGLFGHAVAVRLWRHSKPAAIAMGVVSVVALLLNLSNSLGAIAGRADTATTDRVSKNRAIRAAEAELKRLTDLRDAMPVFVPTDETTVSAAKTAAGAATTAREAECAKRGPLCRDREADERRALDQLSGMAAAKATTDRALRLEADADAQRRKLTDLGPAVTINVHGTAIARLFRLPDSEADFMATAQQFGLAVVVELIIVMCMIGWEVLGRAVSAQSTRSQDASTNSGNADMSAVIRAAPMRAPEQVSIASQPRLKLVAANPAPPAASIPKTLTAALEPCPGQRIEMADLYRRYVADCAAESRPPVRPHEFADPLHRFCRGAGIKTKVQGDLVYLVDVQLVASADRAAKGERA